LKIQKPIFILAPARSGTTIFYNLFTRHKNTAFPEHFADKYWQTPWKFRFIPLMLKQQVFRYKKKPIPHEGKFWHQYHEQSTYLTESDVSKKEQDYIYSVIRTQLKAFKADRFVGRIHDFCIRIRFMNALFPDAFYIILRRDPKAVVSSQYRLLIEDWEKGDNYGRVIEKFENNSSKLETCVNYYLHFINTMEKELNVVKNNTTEIRYEDLVKDPRKELKRLYEFTELFWYDELEKEIPKVLEQKNDEKWLRLPPNVKKILMEEFGTCDY